MKHILILMIFITNAVYSVDYQATCADEKLNIEIKGSFDGFIIIEDAHEFKVRIIKHLYQDKGVKSNNVIPFKMIRELGRKDGWLVLISFYEKNNNDEYALTRKIVKKLIGEDK